MSKKTPNKDTAKTKSEPRLPFRSLLALVLICLATLLASQKVYHYGEIDCGFRQDLVVNSPNNQQLGLEVVADEQSFIKGLSGRPCLPENSGMMFSFSSPDYHKFWMKDMQFNIDIVWLDSAKSVLGITENLNPNTYPQTFTSPLPAQYVLELNSGEAQKLGFQKETSLNF